MNKSPRRVTMAPVKGRLPSRSPQVALEDDRGHPAARQLFATFEHPAGRSLIAKRLHAGRRAVICPRNPVFQIAEMRVAAIATGRILIPGFEGVRVRHEGYQRSEEHTSELQSPCNLVC